MATNEDISGREIVSTRVINAPREKVFAAFRDPERLKRWWGPNGFTNTFETFDFRPGGVWRFTMHGPDGVDYRNVSTFVEIVDGERIVFRHDEPIHGFRMTMTYATVGDKTKLTWRMLFETAEEFEKVKAFIPAANEQNFDRLEKQLGA